MKKAIVILITIILLIVLIIMYFFPKEKTITDTKKYLKIDKNVQSERLRAVNYNWLSGELFPDNMENLTIESYNYWVDEASTTDWKYVINATIHYDVLLEAEKEVNRLEKILDMKYEIADSDYSVLLCRSNLQEQIENYLFPPLLDGMVLLQEYALVSKDRKTIVYTECQLIEGEFYPDYIIEQLKYLQNTVFNDSEND